MRIAAITPTADQPTGIALLEEYMRRQTIHPDVWVVADDGEQHASLTMGQVHVVRERQHEGGRSLAANMLAALKYADADVIVVFEHDDWYRPDHIEVSLRGLQAAKATGSAWQRYYNLPSKSWVVMRNVGSALCNTAFRSELVPQMRHAAERALEAGSYAVDRLFWDSLPRAVQCITEEETVVGIKGLPGRAGLGLGHRPNALRPWEHDASGVKLREWVGAEDAGVYEHVMRRAAR